MVLETLALQSGVALVCYSTALSLMETWRLSRKCWKSDLNFSGGTSKSLHCDHGEGSTRCIHDNCWQHTMGGDSKISRVHAALQRDCNAFGCQSR
eukprot:6472067-Amphidinium_carterae.1